LGVSVGPDKNDRRSLCPVARILTELPPTSTASTALTEDFIATSFCRTVPFSTASSDLARIALARSRENGAFGSNHAHQVVPRIDERRGAFVLKLGRKGMDVKRKPRIVIVGGGFGGVAAARALRKSDAEVFLIDRRNHHIFQPLLYQVATAILSPSEVAAPIRQLARKQKNLSVMLAEVTDLDLKFRSVPE
jgi:NADPH-dependent 2,4-dienoyl-CoA reductase/sulfur reductase-like enzyme